MRAALTSVFSILVIVQLTKATYMDCLVAALVKQANPSDYKTICSENSVISNLTTFCPQNALQYAYQVYSLVCKSNGIQAAFLPTVSISTNGTYAGSSPAAAAPTDTSTSPPDSSNNSSTSSSTGSRSSTTSASPASTSTSGKNTASGMTPKPILFAVSGLLVTALTSIIFL